MWGARFAFVVHPIEIGEGIPPPVVAAAEPEPVVLVAHSASGPLLPLIAHRLERKNVAVVASIFVDARLPYPGQSTLDVLPPPQVEHLRQMTVEGWLPPWPSWWPLEHLETILPDEHLRHLVVDTCPPRLPLSIFTEVLPHVSEHELGTCSYVRLSSTYDAFTDQAEQAGWPVHRLDDHHLAILTSPAKIAETLQDLADTAAETSQFPPGRYVPLTDHRLLTLVLPSSTAWLLVWPSTALGSNSAT